ncbi:uncharacterized protein SPPG_05295 [Spizellomyces punctatus DAOM BR117]|uniref:Uncharacterized protein n=1 Tax=Spizellomyces punctatus (strain DAOM BR117) TaxID=645134 RepID=A0A0L0HGG2_SPIPD|nr:uncharacterized protein SPPG_05295 [Spizellomyces punctatus DAOM BR117]KNC99923.1 hypothetical protein SPPG_05295 [Spizellomyces punctatus DAOM BR117]|eukprot:XP_016607963.1 hypothetical protein SPPG_05295 [Spizellomyces punctatus DAOM BR117]
MSQAAFSNKEFHAAPERKKFTERVDYEKPSREILEELHHGPILASTVGITAEVVQSPRDQANSRSDSMTSLFGDHGDATTRAKNSW